MKRLAATMLVTLLVTSLSTFAAADASSCPGCIVQNIFDDGDSSERVVTPPEPEKMEPVENDEPAIKPKPQRKKKRARKKKRTTSSDNANAPSGYSAKELARASYTWAPETEPLVLSREMSGLAQKPQAADTPRAPVTPLVAKAPTTDSEAKNAAQEFKLPKIPLTQVLIVAGFVILFLIYRFRIGRQMRRKR